MRIFLNIAVFCLLTVLLGLPVLPADEIPEPAQADEPSEEPPSIQVGDLIEALKGDDADAAGSAMDVLVAKGEDAIQPLIDLRETGEEPAAERAVQTLKRIGVVDGLYVRVNLFRIEFEPSEKIGVQFYFRNYSRKVVTIFNPVSIRNLEHAYGLGWKLALKTAEGKAVANVDMNKGVAPPNIRRSNLVTVQPGESCDDIVFLETLFGLEELKQGGYVLEGEYTMDKTALEIIKTMANLEAENLHGGPIAPPGVQFKVALVSIAEVDKETEKKIRQWIKELGSEQYQTRRNAETELDKLGVTALKYLKEAVDATSDAQIKYSAQQLIDKIEKPEEKMVTYLGIRMGMEMILEPGADAGGVFVQSVIGASPAERAGLQGRDMIVRINGMKIRGDMVAGSTYLRKHIQSRRDGEKITLTILRNGKEKDLEITLGKIPVKVLEQG